MEEQDQIIMMTGTEQEPGEEISRARTSSAKTAAAKKTASKTGAAAKTASKTGAKTAAKTAAKKPASGTAAKKTSSSSTAKKPAGTAAKKTAASTQPKLTAREKKLIQNYRKCGEAGKLMIDTMAEKTAEMGGKGSDSESGLGSVLSSITQNLDLSSLTGLLGK